MAENAPPAELQTFQLMGLSVLGAHRKKARHLSCELPEAILRDGLSVKVHQWDGGQEAMDRVLGLRFQ